MCQRKGTRPGRVGCAKDYTHKGAEERLGAFGSAHEGCLFLDEAGDLPEEVQVKLLRALDDGRFVRLGDGRTQVADVLVVGATNRGPDALRQDFLDRFQYRLRVPNLNQRLSDVPLLLRHLFAKHARTVPEFVEQFCPDGDPSRPQVNPDFLNLLLRPRYSGNARELSRVVLASASHSFGRYLSLTSEVEQAMSSRDELGPSTVTEERPSAPPVAAGRNSAPPASEAILVPSRDAIETALRAAEGNASRAAQILGITRHALARRMKYHGL